MPTKIAEEGRILLHNKAAAQWICFGAPYQIITAGKLEEVLPALRHVEESVRRRGWYAAGFISYEAAAAFDPALCTHSPNGFPLLWFGLYPAPENVNLPRPDFQAYSLGEWIPSVSQADYSHAIARIKEYIRSGDTYQVNYTLRLRVPFLGDPFNLFLAMAHAQDADYAAWIDTGRMAICSASPELFFSLKGNRLTCKPMKGTVKRGRTLDEDLSLAEWLCHSDKNCAENVMIVDMIRNDLGRIAEAGSVQTLRLFEVERHPTLWQMTSTITAASGKTLAEIMTALFPCASITGAPKVRTTRIIAEIETTPRCVYTGCIGFVAPDGDAQFSVAIRTAIVDRLAGQAEYGAGGGIVWDSESGEEYAEALLKSRVLVERRPEFSLLETLLWTPGDEYFLLDYHLRRLADSAIYFNYPARIEQIRSRLFQQAKNFAGRPQRVRLLVGSDGSADIQATQLTEEPARPVRIKLAKEPVNSADIFLYHKTTHRQVYEDALRACPVCDDVLLWNERGELTESCIANVVVEIGGERLTPPVASGLLAGTFRAWALDRGEIREQVIPVDDLPRCENIYLINSVRKWRDAVLT